MRPGLAGADANSFYRMGGTAYYIMSDTRGVLSNLLAELSMRGNI